MIELFSQTRGLVLSKTAKDTSVVFFGNITSSILGIVFTILAARFLGPENWGIVAAVTSLITILVALGDLGLGSGIFRFASGLWSIGRTVEAEKFFNTVFLLRFISAIIFVSILILLSPWAARVFLHSSDSRLMLLTSFGVLGTLLLDFQVVSMQARQSWRMAAVFIALTNLIRVLAILVLTALGMVGLVGVLLVFSGSLFLAWILSLTVRPVQFRIVDNWWTIARKVVSFSSWMAGNKIVSSINSRVDVLLLVALTGTYTTGIYAAANRLALGVPLILGSFATVLAPRFASLKERELLSFFKKAIGLSILIAILLVIGVLVAPLAISLFGPAYRDSSPVLQWLLVGFIPFVLSTPSVNILIYHFQKPQIVTLLSIFQLPLIFLLNFYGIPRFGVFGPVITLSIVNLSTFLVTSFFAWRYLRRYK